MGGSYGTVRLTVMGGAVLAPLVRVSRAAGTLASSPRPLRCIDRIPIKPSDGLDDMIKKRGNDVGMFKCVCVHDFRAGWGTIITPGTGLMTLPY